MSLLTAPAHADFQLWSEVDVTLPLTDRLELTWVSLARFSSDVREPLTYSNDLYGDIVTPFNSQYNTYNYASGRGSQ